MLDLPVTTTTAHFDRHRRSLACGILTATVFIAAVVVARRLSGEAQPLAEWGAALIGVLAVGVTVFCTVVPGVLRDPLDRPARLLATGLASTPGLLLGLSLLPSESVAGVASLLSIYFGAVVAGTLADEWSPWSESHISSQLAEARRALAARARHITPQTECSPAHPPSPVSSIEAGSKTEPLRESTHSTRTSAPIITEDSTSLTDDTAAAPFGGSIPHPSEIRGITQWMSRCLNEEGENAEGGCQAVFEAGQKLVAIHIPFAPSFAVAPEFECEPLDESDVRIKVAARHSYGMRIEVTRNGDTADAQTVPLGWFAFSAASVEASQAAAA